MTVKTKEQIEQEIQAVQAHPGILADHQIRDLAVNHGMIEPFVEKQTREGVISYGLSSYGYDSRCSDEFMIFTNVDNAIVDPKDFSQQSFVERKTDV
ncbi:MAG: dCTP deaminase, partial [Pseudomonadota bacterium]|nr:dCTP deaminase [Pseudomonadota bacterium]